MKLTIIRGLPGSGKSTMAKLIGGFHIEADMFHIRDGIYDFKREMVPMAHSWCFETFKVAFSQKMDVIVSNTFVKRWEYLPYIDFAEKCIGGHAKILVAKGDYGSVHSVPDDVIARMRASWED